MGGGGQKDQIAQDVFSNRTKKNQNEQCFNKYKLSHFNDINTLLT